MAKPKQSLLDKIEVANPSKQSKNPNIPLEGKQAELVDDYRDVCVQMKNIEAKKDALYAQVKEIGQDLYAERAAGGEMENLKLVGNEGAVTFMVQKNFGKVSEEAKEIIEAQGMGECIERDQIQLKAGLDDATQERILMAVAKEFGQKEALAMFSTQYKVKENALVTIAAKGKKALVMAALKFLKPVQQIRT